MSIPDKIKQLEQYGKRHGPHRTPPDWTEEDEDMAFEYYGSHVCQIGAFKKMALKDIPIVNLKSFQAWLGGRFRVHVNNRTKAPKELADLAYNFGWFMVRKKIVEAIR